MEKKGFKPTHQGHGGSHHGGSRPPDSGGGDQTIAKFKELIQRKGFKDDEVMQLSEKLGKSLAEGSQARGDRERSNTRTQMRKFYNLVRVAQTKASASGESSDDLKVKLRTLQAQVAYSTVRSTGIDRSFKEFFDASITIIIGSADLKQTLKDFGVFFEALYAYFYFYTESK